MSLSIKNTPLNKRDAFFPLLSALRFTAGDLAMACGIGSAVESCILTSQYPQGLAAWQSRVQWALPSADWSVPPESKSKRSKVSVYGPSKR